jgi:hypothetical protein
MMNLDVTLRDLCARLAAVVARDKATLDVNSARSEQAPAAAGAKLGLPLPAGSRASSALPAGQRSFAKGQAHVLWVSGWRPLALPTAHPAERFVA